jgi:hypothetical protein
MCLVHIFSQLQCTDKLYRHFPLSDPSPSSCHHTVLGFRLITVQVGQQHEPITPHISESVLYRLTASCISTHVGISPKFESNGRKSSSTKDCASDQKCKFSFYCACRAPLCSNKQLREVSVWNTQPSKWSK